MRFRVSRLLGVIPLYLLFALVVSGCSGQQQQEEGLEVSEESTGSEDSASESSESSNSASESSDSESSDSESSNSASDSESSDAELSNSSMEDSATADATENDLQEIIQEMNGQQTESTGDATSSDALAQDPTMVDPAMQGTNTAGMGAAPMDPAMAGGGAPMDTGAAPSASIPFQPGGTPAGPALPEMGSKMAYIVQSGDTLAKISTKIYGTPSRWNELATLSGLANPSRIYPGDVVYYTLDDSAVAFASAYESVQRSEEMVQPGDTLATIAQRIYGTSTAWKAIWRQNDRIDNPDIVAPGTVVYYISSGALTAALKQARAELTKLATVDKASSKKTVTAQHTKTNDADKISSLKLDNGILLAEGHEAYEANSVASNLNSNLFDIILA